MADEAGTYASRERGGNRTHSEQQSGLAQRAGARSDAPMVEPRSITPRSPRAALEPDRVPEPKRHSARARHPVIVISDSDVRVAAGHLEVVASALAPQDVGAVTCLYRRRRGARPHPE